MPHTNQGVFQKLINDYSNLESQYYDCKNKYFYNDEWTGGCDEFFTGFAYEADYIYQKANKLIGDINGMLISTTLEIPSKTERYSNMVNACQEIIRDLKYRFNNTLSLIEMSGGYLTDVEKRTVEKLSIYSAWY
ncbi:MAG: hypothetical protein K2I00_06670 [Ruminococcus sp.]|nr:hypothetical protein [Ruminococcus sp.]